MDGAYRFVRSTGSTIAAPGAVGWITDFLNAAFYARPREERDVDDLRLAFGILATRWHRGGRRLGARDLAGFARAFTVLRVRGHGTLDREALLAGAARLHGEWFGAAWQDPTRRAHGIAFETAEEARRFVPAARMQDSALARLTPPASPADRRVWSTYPRVGLPDAAAAVAFLAEPARWPDMGATGGRFTALRPGGLAGQTFEIDLCLLPVPRAPVFTRGYVTCTALWLDGDPVLGPAVGALSAQAGAELVAPGGRPLAHVELTTHAGHPLGRAISHLVIGEDADGTAWIRDVGEWDPLGPALAAAYAAGGGRAQHAFWGPDDAEASMLVQLARVSDGSRRR